MSVALSGCGESEKIGGQTIASPGPATFENIMADPALYAGQSVEFKAYIAVGETVTAFGEATKSIDYSWEFPRGANHSVSAPADAPGNLCIFLNTIGGGRPAFPPQLIVTETLSPCEKGPPPQMLVGKVGGVKSVNLIIDGQPSAIRVLVLVEPGRRALARRQTL